MLSSPPPQLDGGKTFVEPTAIMCGKVEGQENVAVRVHDACFTSGGLGSLCACSGGLLCSVDGDEGCPCGPTLGRRPSGPAVAGPGGTPADPAPLPTRPAEVLGSLKCDCAEQLITALDYIRDHPPGIVIYLWQEGRGIGLANKIAAYKLQEQGLDTVDANRALGLPDDLREYTSVRNILRDLGVKSIRLMTNNPRKISVLTELGVKVTDRIPIQIEAGEHNKVRARPPAGAGGWPRERAAGAAAGGTCCPRRCSAGLMRPLCPAAPRTPPLPRPPRPPAASTRAPARPQIAAMPQAYLEAKTMRMDHMIEKKFWASAPPSRSLSSHDAQLEAEVAASLAAVEAAAATAAAGAEAA
jgi:GTP cyclohydrolase II